MNWLIKNSRAALACAVASLLLSFNAKAGTVDFEPVVGTINGTGTAVFEFDVTVGGVFEAILTDLASPAPFTLLGLGIANLDGIVLFEDFGTETLSLDFSVDPGTYLALVGGIADGNTNIGTFGLEISDVPVPGVGLLMMSALSTLGFMLRRS